MSRMVWFRFYDEVLDDPKVQRLPGELFKIWVNLLCLANRGSPRGALPANIEDIAFSLRLSVEVMTEAIDKLTALGLIDRTEDEAPEPHNWNGRQFKSDDSNARVALHRERKQPLQPSNNVTLHGNGDVTLHVTPPDTDTDTDTEQSKNNNPPISPQPAETTTLRTVPKRHRGGGMPPQFEQFWSVYPKRNGFKGNKAAALKQFLDLPPEDWPEVLRAAEVYSAVCGPGGAQRKSKDAERFLKDDFWRSVLEIDPNDLEQRSSTNGYQTAAERRDQSRAALYDALYSPEDDSPTSPNGLPAGRASRAGPAERGGPQIVEVVARRVG